MAEKLKDERASFRKIEESEAEPLRRQRQIMPSKKRVQNKISDTNALIDYLKMVFNFKQWDQNSMTQMGSTISGIYAMLLICIYVAFAFTELVKYPELDVYLERHGFFLYLFLACDLYFIYIFVSIIRTRRNLDKIFKNSKTPMIVENDKSHGSLTVRCGAIIFGIGTFAHFVIEMLAFFENRMNSSCRYWTDGANAFLILIFILLQTFLIFMYPRLNLHSHQFMNRMATMHVVATNIILWFRTLIKESIEEIWEYEESSTHHFKDVTEGEFKCDFILARMKKMMEIEEECKSFGRNNILPENILADTSPYFYPFIIEFSLIGASVFYIMSNHVGKQTSRLKLRQPNPMDCFNKIEFSHLMKGTIAGLFIIGIAVINLILFFGFEHGEKMKDEAEYVSKVSNTVINLIGICALIIGIAELNILQVKSEEDSNNSAPDLDMFLLKFTSFFSLMYVIFTIITGCFNAKIEGFPNELHVINGVFEMLQLFLQLCFISSLKLKESLDHNPNYQQPHRNMPGRQITIFLFLFNLAQWFVFTFEIQKVRSSKVEEEFYGFMPWVLIQRVTLPLAVFYRFHSAVVSIELCKEVYSGNSTETEEKMFEEMAEFPSNRLNEDDDVHKVPVPEY